MTKLLSKTAKKRLLQLADHLDAVSKKKFDLQSFMELPEYPEQPRKAKELFENLKPVKGDKTTFHLKEGFCGTTACVLGHAATMPEFNKKGLYVEVEVYGISGKAATYKDLDAISTTIVFKKGGERSYVFHAGAKFFDIPQKHADILFSGGNSTQIEFYTGDRYKYADEVTPKQVAKALRNYVDTDGKSLQDIMDSHGY